MVRHEGLVAMFTHEFVFKAEELPPRLRQELDVQRGLPADDSCELRVAVSSPNPNYSEVRTQLLTQLFDAETDGAAH